MSHGTLTPAVGITDVRDAIRIATDYVRYVLPDEELSQVGLEETEWQPQTGRWKITIGFSRPWSVPKTRAQEVLTQLGAAATHRRSFKVVEIAPDGAVLSMKDRRE